MLGSNPGVKNVPHLHTTDPLSRVYELFRLISHVYQGFLKNQRETGGRCDRRNDRHKNIL